jgi:hypothetical protein
MSCRKETSDQKSAFKKWVGILNHAAEHSANMLDSALSSVWHRMNSDLTSAASKCCRETRDEDV